MSVFTKFWNDVNKNAADNEVVNNPPVVPFVKKYRIIPDDLLFSVQELVQITHNITVWKTITKMDLDLTMPFPYKTTEQKCEEYIKRLLERQQKLIEQNRKIEIHKISNPPREVPPFRII